MMREEINEKALGLVATLEMDYFTIVLEKNSEGQVIGQHRVLKKGKTLDAFNSTHAIIWQNHEAELIADGFMEPRPTPVPSRDLFAELDTLKAKVAELEVR